MYAGFYSNADLNWWADRILEWDRDGLDVYVYFNNDDDGNAVQNARTLRNVLAPYVEDECGSAQGRQSLVVLGAPGRIRTCDTRFRKPMLYPLSYEGGAP